MPDIDHSPRCWNCGKLLAEMLTRPYRLRCVRCKKVNEAKAGAPVLART